MYFHLKKSPSSKVLQLLESYRTHEGKSRHRVVVSLGNAKIPEKDLKWIAKYVELRLYNREELLEPSPEQQVWIDIIVKRIEREGRWHPFSKTEAGGREEATDSSQTSESQVVDGVCIEDIDHTHNTSLGPELLGLYAWDKLNMDGLLKSLQFNPAQRHAACVSIINRLIDPVSENALNSWLATSSLQDLTFESGVVEPSRYYRVSEKLVNYKKKIEGHIRSIVDEQFDFQPTILLYDLTNSHFEGVCKLNPKAKRGRNKQKRHDCPQVTVGVCFNEEGFVQFYKIFAGNTNDSSTLLEMVLEMERCGEASELLSSQVKPLVVIDAGIATQKNLALLREKGFGYLVNESRGQRKEYQEYFQTESEFEFIEGRGSKPGVKIRILDIETAPSDSSNKQKARARIVQAPERKVTVTAPQVFQTATDNQVPSDGATYQERLILCRSDQRAAKEQAILSGAERKFVEDLEGLSRRIDQGRLKDPVKIERAIGKLQGRHRRISRYYKVELKPKELGDCTITAKPTTLDKKKGKVNLPKASCHLSYWRSDSEYETADELFGCYVLRTDQCQLEGDKLWHLYMTLSKAEAGFRALKSELGLRPNFHRLEERVDAHIFITILAYQLQRFILYTLSLLEERRCWPTLKRVLQTHTYATLLVPTKDGELYRIRKAGTPEACQKTIYNQLGIDYKNLPKSKILVQKKTTTL
jgi:transposase